MKLEKSDLIDAIREVVKAELVENVKVQADVKEAVKQEVVEEIAEEKKAINIGVALKQDSLNDAQEEADKKKWKTFGEFALEMWRYRNGFKAYPDNRLIFVDKTGTPSIPKQITAEDQKSENVFKTLTEGVDSAGGFCI